LTGELKELQDIKRLLILLLQANKVSQPEIAKALGVSDRHLRRLMSQKEGQDAEEG
jgi:transcriptional antiterminator